MRTCVVGSVIAMSAMVLGAACGPGPTSPGIRGAGRFEVTFKGAGVTIGGVLYRPAIAPGGVRAALVLVHGHLPQGVNGAATIEPFAARYTDRGYITLAMSMRGWPPSGGTDDCAVAQPDDIVRAVEWLAQQPGVAADRIGLMGYSKGGQMILLAAARGAQVRAVVAHYPPTDLALWKATTDRVETIEYLTRACEPPPGLAARSPISVADRIAAPVLLMHGDADVNVPLDQSRFMEAALRTAGRDVSLFVVPGGGHGFVGAAAEVAYPVVDAFLASRLDRR